MRLSSSSLVDRRSAIEIQNFDLMNLWFDSQITRRKVRQCQKSLFSFQLLAKELIK